MKTFERTEKIVAWKKSLEERKIWYTVKDYSYGKDYRKPLEIKIGDYKLYIYNGTEMVKYKILYQNDITILEEGYVDETTFKKFESYAINNPSTGQEIEVIKNEAYKRFGKDYTKWIVETLKEKLDQ